MYEDMKVKSALNFHYTRLGGFHTNVQVVIIGSFTGNGKLLYYNLDNLLRKDFFYISQINMFSYRHTHLQYGRI